MCTRTDGTLLSMPYEREQDVIGWARHPMKVGPGTSGELTGLIPGRAYPTLQDLTAAEIPTTPTPPADTALVGEISVTDRAGLAAMTPGNHYSLANDIDLSVGGAWTPLTFNSALPIVIEGNGHTISNLTINSPASDSQGFIGLIDGAGGGQIRNLNFSNCSVTGRSKTAIFCAAMQSDAANFYFKNITFTNCAVAHNNAAANIDYLGLLFGWANTKSAYISGCTATDCTVNATASRSQYVGGLIGALREQTAATFTNIVDCAVSGGTMTIVAGRANYCGGFVGYQMASGSSTVRNHNFYDCASSMDVIYNKTSGTSVYGFGDFFGYVENAQAVTCTATGSLSFTGPSTTVSSVGGFIGSSCCNETYINCHCTGSVTFTDAGGAPGIDSVGGFIGFADVDIQILRCYSQSAILFETAIARVKAVGGFVGQSDCWGTSSSYSRSWAEGDVTFAKEITSGYEEAGVGFGFIGGFIGWVTNFSDGTTMADFLNCYTWSSIILSGSYPAELTIGGFIGGWEINVLDLTFENCYCAQTDSAYGSGYAGQIPAGDSHGFGGGGGTTAVQMTACFYDQETSSLTVSVLAAAHLTNWMLTKANYVAAGWDFDTIWTGLDDTTWDYSADGLGPNSVAVIPSTAEDEVWLVVARVIGGQIVRFLEQMQPRDFGEQDSQWFLDAALSTETPDADGIVRGLGHLEGEEVAALVDGGTVPRQTVVDGTVNLGVPILRKAIVGLPFRYILKPQRFDLYLDGETTKGSLKTFKELVVDLYQSGDVWYGTDVDHLFSIPWRTTEAWGSPPALHTGDEVVCHEGGFDVEDSIIVTGDGPIACCVRALVPRIQVTGR